MRNSGGSRMSMHIVQCMLPRHVEARVACTAHSTPSANVPRMPGFGGGGGAPPGEAAQEASDAGVQIRLYTGCGSKRSWHFEMRSQRPDGSRDLPQRCPPAADVYCGAVRPRGLAMVIQVIMCTWPMLKAVALAVQAAAVWQADGNASHPQSRSCICSRRVACTCRGAAVLAV